MLISAFDVVFISFWAQLSCIRWFSGGVVLSNPKIECFCSAVGVFLHLHFVVVVASSAFWHDGVIRSLLDRILKPPWPPPLKRMSIRGLFIVSLFSSTRRLCLIPFWCAGSGLCQKLVRIMKFVSTGSRIWVESFWLFRDYMMQLWCVNDTWSRLRRQIIFATLVPLLLQWFSGQIEMYSTCSTITQAIHY